MPPAHAIFYYATKQPALQSNAEKKVWEIMDDILDGRTDQPMRNRKRG